MHVNPIYPIIADTWATSDKRRSNLVGDRRSNLVSSSLTGMPVLLFANLS